MTPLAGTVQPAPDDPIVQLCVFSVGGEEYVLDIMRIREIIQPLKVTAVPRAPEFIEGVIHLRGGIVPVVDLRKRLGLPSVEPTKKSKTLICLVGGKTVGLLVDAVIEVLRVPRSQVKRAPSLLSKGPRFFLGVCGPTDRLKLLLNLKALLESSEKVPGSEVRALARRGEPESSVG